jgi:hypothetical protein
MKALNKKIQACVLPELSAGVGNELDGCFAKLQASGGSSALLEVHRSADTIALRSGFDSAVR